MLSASPLLRRSLIAACAFGIFGAMQAARAATILVEFGETLTGEGPGGLWNRYATPAAFNGSALKDAQGVLTAITASYTGQLNSSANAGTSLTYDNTAAVGNPGWVATTTNNAVAGDLFYTDNSSSGITGEVTLIFTGFTVGDVVSIDFLGSRNVTNADGFYSFSIDGGTTFTGFTMLNPDGSATTADGWAGTDTLAKAYDNQLDGYNNHRYLNANEVTLTGTTLQVKARDISTANGNFAALNAMRLTVVPEPASATLLTLGGALSIGLIRHRRKG